MKWHLWSNNSHWAVFKALCVNPRDNYWHILLLLPDEVCDHLGPQFNSVAQSGQTLWDPMDCSKPGFPVHPLLELAQTHVHWVHDAIQPSHPLSSPSPPAFNLSQHQGLFQWVSSSHQVAKVLEFQFQHQSFQWIFRIKDQFEIERRRNEKNSEAVI